mmetsp:Transcript_14819/g.20442  ORF Transcript_14819/g.20442 Transcript_14819/m.20442 type:complete len:185 (-) Transcript_14819:374-928(-)
MNTIMFFVGMLVLCIMQASAFVAHSKLASVSSRSSLSMLKEGEGAPDFALKNQFGKVVKLSQFKGKKDVVVFFYPKDDTPGCTKEACAFNDSLEDFSKLKAEVIGISSDEDHTAFVQKYGLQMTMLSDVGGKVRSEWKVPKAMFGALDGRVTYVIGKDGVCKKVHDDLLKAESHVEVAFKALQA